MYPAVFATRHVVDDDEVVLVLVLARVLCAIGFVHLVPATDTPGLSGSVSVLERSMGLRRTPSL